MGGDLSCQVFDVFGTCPQVLALHAAELLRENLADREGGGCRLFASTDALLDRPGDFRIVHDIQERTKNGGFLAVHAGVTVVMILNPGLDVGPDGIQGGTEPINLTIDLIGANTSSLRFKRVRYAERDRPPLPACRHARDPIGADRWLTPATVAEGALCAWGSDAPSIFLSPCSFRSRTRRVRRQPGGRPHQRPEA